MGAGVSKTTAKEEIDEEEEEEEDDTEAFLGPQKTAPQSSRKKANETESNAPVSSSFLMRPEDKDDENKQTLFGFFNPSAEIKDNLGVLVHSTKENLVIEGREPSCSSLKRPLDLKDDNLERAIKELHVTFDELGILGKDYWDDEDDDPSEGEEEAKSHQPAEDLKGLEPMRNKIRINRRLSRYGMVWNADTTSRASSGESKRPFKYSWEIEEDNFNKQTEQDQWSIDEEPIPDIDVNKFKEVNKPMAVREFDSTVIPEVNYEAELEAVNSPVGLPYASQFKDTNPSCSPASSQSHLTYDPQEQNLMAKIEHEFT